MIITRRATLALAALPLAARAQAQAQAQAQTQAAWSPSQPVRVIIPFTPGGTMDPVLRIMQATLATDLGQPVVLDHKPGAATVVGTQELARSPADGQTLLMIANSFAANITLRPSTPYNALRDFAPITMATVVPHVLAIPPGLAKDFASFLAAARQPGAQFAFGSYGIGTSNHLGGEQFSRAAGLGAVHVPYTGGPQANTDLMSGRLQFMFANLPDMIQPVQTGQLRAIAISAEARVSALPDIPTMKELGFPLVLSDSWFGLITRAEVPTPARTRLEAAFIAALTRPEIKARLEEQAFTILARPSAAFGAEIRRYAEVYAEVIKAGGIKVE